MPVLSPDLKTLYFVRSGHEANAGGAAGGQDIWYVVRENQGSTWGSPRNMGSPLNNAYNNAVGSVTDQGRVLWLNNQYLGRRGMRPGLSYSTRQASGWSRPLALNIPGFQPRSGALSFFLAPGDSILLLSMEADSSRSDDLFISRFRKGQWSAPANIGPVINSAGFEIAPFLSPDLETLYFASNGHGGFGQSDIFRSKRLDDSWLQWSTPENLGRQVNSAGFDAYLVLDPAGGQAYFTSEDGVKPDTDIYSIALAAIATSPATAPRVPGPAEGATPKKVVLRFHPSSAQLTDSAQQALRELGSWLSQDPRFLVFLSGHADESGPENQNLVLSRERAQAAADYLSGLGIAPQRLQVQVYGSSRPLSGNASAAGRARNRRVEVEVVPE
ncbi:MAG: OmpA family protein [Adhaeribacter sp.]